MLRGLLMTTVPAASKNPRLGILLMVAAVATFAAQDGFSKALAGQYNTLMVVMIRYWAFAAFVILMAVSYTHLTLPTNREV